MFGLFRKNFKVGLDLGEDSLKYSVVDGGTVIDLWQGKLIPARKNKDHILKDEDLTNRIIDLLKNCKKDCPLYKSAVNTAIQGEGTVSRYIEMPKLSKKELDTAVTSQALKYIPFPMESVNLSYVTVPQIEAEKNKTGIFFVAAQKKSIEDMKNTLKKCGLELERIETPVMAMARAFSRNHKLPSDRFFALIHTGFRLTHLVVIRDRYPYYSREISLAGRDFTYAFQMGQQSSWEESENYKLNYDVMECDVSIEPFIARWQKEVKKSLGFFTKQLPGNCKVEELYLSGGTSLLKGLDKRLEEYLKMPVKNGFWDQIKRVDKFSHIKEVGIYEIATGLALGE